MAAGGKDLKRHLGFFDVLMFGVGGVVGAGIYAIIGEAGGESGNLLWLSFGIAAFVAFLTGLAYAEFVSRYPDAGGSFEYVKQSFGKRTAYVLSVVMFLTSVVSPAAIAISFSDYLGRLVDWSPTWTTLGIILLMMVLNLISVKISSYYNTFATIVTLVGLALVVGFSFSEWGSTDLLQAGEQGWMGILSGSALIFFSYVGFEDLVKTAEETKEPEKNLPRGIVWSALIVTVIYVLIAISAVSVMPAGELAQSKGPLAEVMTQVAGSGWATALIIIALFATSKTILSNILGSSRLVFDVARDSEVTWLKKLTEVRDSGTPFLAIFLTAGVVILFALIGNLKVVASISNIFVFVLFLSVNFALINYRRNKAKDDAPFKIPLNVGKTPVPTVVAIVGLLVLLGFNIYNLVQG